MNYFTSVHSSFFCVLSFMCGVISISLLGTDVVYVLVVGFLLMSIIARKKLLIIICLFFIVGCIRMDVWDQLYGTAQLDPGETQFSGYISAEPDIREYNTRLIVTLDGSHERVLVTTAHYPEYEYGDYLVFTGELRYPTAFETDTGRMFHWDIFLKKDKIYYVMKYPEVQRISVGTHGNIITTHLLIFKQVLVLQIQKYLPEPHSSLLAGLLVGAKSSLGDELLDDLRATGVIHIVVLSGFNVTIIAEAIMRVLMFLGVLGSSIAGSIAILFFTIMTGASATVVRAALMAFLVLVARATGYHAQMARTLFIAGFFMVLHNPMILLYDPSFQLSFLATLGLIVLVPWIEARLTWIPQTYFDFRGLAAASIGTQVFVFPLLMYMTGEVSLVSPIVNILVLWVVPFTMLVGFIMIIVSTISRLFVIPIMTLTWVLLGYILTIVAWFAQIPFASIHVPAISMFTLGLVYGIYFLIWMYNQKIWKSK